MKEIQIQLNENFFFILTFFFICVIHLIPLIRYSSPVSWDSGYYFYAISKNIPPLPNLVEPFYFHLAQPLSKIFGIIPTMKLIQFLSIVILSSGTYLFVNKYYDKKTAIIIMFLISFIPATTRIWADQYRNILALSFLPYFLLTSLQIDNKNILLSGFFLGLIGLTHRLVFFSIVLSYLFFNAIQFLKRNTQYIKSSFLTLTIACLLASPYLIASFLPSTTIQAEQILRWDEHPFNFSYVLTTSNGIIVLAFMSFFLTTGRNRKEDIILASFFTVAFILFTGIVGTPFLVYERYLLFFSFVAVLFSAPYLNELLNSLQKHNFIYILIIILLLGYNFYIGFSYLNQLTPYISQQELDAFKWIQSNIPKNATLLIPSREHYWISALTNKNVVPLEWYELLGQRTPSEEVQIITASKTLSDIAINNTKIKYNTTDLYIFFTAGSDPVIPTGADVQAFIEKTNTWNLTKQWNNSFLFKV